MSLKRKILNFLTAAVIIFGSAPFTVLTASAANDPGEAPSAKKIVTDNGDGTYNITLEITGKSSESTIDSKANVVIVVDTSNSMDDDTTSCKTWNGNHTRCREYYTRLEVAQSAINSLVDTLLAQNTSTTTDMVEIALVDFATNINNTQSKTTNSTTIHNWVNALDASRGWFDEWKGGTNWEAALLEANGIDFGDEDDTYIIFVSDGNPTFRNSKYHTYSDNDRRNDYNSDYGLYGNGSSDPNGWNYGAAEAVVTQIAESGKTLYTVGAFGDATAMENLSDADHYYDASNPDKLTEAFGEIATQITNALSVSDVHILDGITAATSTSVNGTTGDFIYEVPTSWGSDYNKATITANADGTSSVTWVPGENKTLSSTDTARISFTVWPSQAAMDCLANLKNGESNADICDEDDLESYGLVKGVDKNGKVIYKLMTNTEASFQYRTYTTVNGVPTEPSNLSGSLPMEEDREDAVLPETMLSVTKFWADNMQPSQRYDEYKDGIKLTLSEDGTVVREYTFDYSTEDEWAEDSYKYAVAPGMMKEIESETDPIALIAKKIVTATNGKKYAILETGHDYTFAESPDSGHYKLTKRSFHPMMVSLTEGDGGQIHDVTFIDENTVEISDIAMTKLMAENTLNGGIEVQKIVKTNGSVDDSVEEKFDVRVTILEGEDGGNYKIFYADGHDSGNISYNGKVVDATIGVGDILRVKDLKDGTTFKVEEINIPAGYSDTSIDYQLISFDEDPDGKPIAEGEDAQIVHGNRSSKVVITNYRETGSLTVSKTVDVDSGNATQAKNTDFTFNLKVYTDSTKTTLIKDYGSFKLHDGQTSDEFTNIPADAYYEVTETEMPGFTADSLVKSGTITAREKTEVSFTNTYAITEEGWLTQTITAQKAFPTGYEQFWLDDEFTLILTGNGETQRKQVSKINYEASFDVTIKDYGTGTYTYTIVEDENGFRDGVYPMAPGANITVTIEVEDNGDGTLGLAKPISYSTTPAVFYNSYKSEGALEGALKFTKEISGRDWEDFDSYEFEISVNNDGPLPETTSITVTSADEFDFGTIAFSTEHIGKEYTYTVSEKDIDSSIKAMTKANDITFTVSVLDNEDGTLQLVVSDHDTVFTNVYTPAPTDEDEFTSKISIEKEVIDKSGSFESETFKFEITAKDFDSTTESKEKVEAEIETNASNLTGSATPAEGIVFSAAGDYTFVVTEAEGSTAGMTYDNNEIEIVIHVKDNTETGKLYIDSVDNVPAKFTNTYEPDPAVVGGNSDVKVSVTKEITGLHEGAPTVDFTFSLKDEEGNEITATVSGAGETTFTDELTFDKVGTYTYTMTEVLPSSCGGQEACTEGGYTYDESEKTVEIIVTDDHEGKLVAAVNGNNPTFTNVYAAEPVTIEGFMVSKNIEFAENAGPEEDEEFQFELVDENGDTIQTITITGAGEGSFDEMTFDEIGTYTFTINEISQESEYYEYDETVYTVTVVVTDNGGELVAEVSYAADSEEADAITFTNQFFDGRGNEPGTPDTGRGTFAKIDTVEASSFMAAALVAMFLAVFVLRKRKDEE